MEAPFALWAAYAVSNLVGLLYLWAAFKAPRWARLLFALLFGWASWFNYTTCREQPDVYLMFADSAVGIYAGFINGWFRDHITTFVSLIAIGQGMIAVGMILKGVFVKLACIGAIVFLLAIAPLGVYAAFPFSLTMSAAAYILFRKDNQDYLWKAFRHTE